MNQSGLSEVIQGLEKRRDHISIAIDVLRAYGLTMPADLPAPRQTLIEEPQTRRRRKPINSAKVRARKSTTGNHCEKHPDATEFDDKGRCRLCQREYAKEYALRKKAGTPTSTRRRRPATASTTATPAIHTAAPRAFIWSKPQRCPKCGEMARLRRLATADLAKDGWIHVGPNCVVKIANYQIKDDLKYLGDSTATPPQSQGERVRCPDCNESFPNERAMEIHAERVHFAGRDADIDDNDE